MLNADKKIRLADKNVLEDEILDYGVLSFVWYEIKEYTLCKQSFPSAFYRKSIYLLFRCRYILFSNYCIANANERFFAMQIYFCYYSYKGQKYIDKTAVLCYNSM